ncbi:MAG: O-antigen ligase family protein [Chitinophagales bacterium]
MKSSLHPSDIQQISPIYLFSGFAVVTLLSVFGAIVLEQSVLYALPCAILLLLFLLIDLKKIFLLLIFLMPFSIEVDLGAVATDFPTEPLMVLLMFAAFLYFRMHPNALSKQFTRHPVVLLILLHLVWIGITVVYSLVFLVSFKFFLVKLWYITVFVFLAGLFIKEEKDFKPVFWLIFVPLVFITARAIYLHWTYDFGFRMVNKTMVPFFRNHVNYAVFLVIFLPYIWLARRWVKKGSLVSLFLHLGLVVILTGIWFAYTRAAYASILLIPAIYYIFKFRLSAFLGIIGTIVITLSILYYSQDYRFLDFAPDFESTIYHHKLGSHLSATFEGKDVSFMERVHRWIAAINMSQDNFWAGFGPGNFYQYYKNYTIGDFETYVSDNPEKSGVHNYFLMTLVEQGIIGLFIFIVFILALFVTGENIYHAATDPHQRTFIMVIMMSIAFLVLNLFVSDLLEADKIGPLFFMNIAMLINQGILVKNKQQVSLSQNPLPNPS